MPQIAQLPPHVVNKIAAGEVIERPASVLKELLENSIDGGALRIDATIEQGGLELVRVVDNGCGVPADELLLAVTSHATSKIRSDEDLFGVATLGFRGEALASIASVSRLAIRSRRPESAGGAELEIVGGAAGAVAPCGGPVGTSVEVRQLFFNTPVRRKFLRSTQTESGHASEAFTRLALGHPQVHFTLVHNGRTLFDLPPVADLRDRIAVLFDRELAESLIDVESVDGAVRLSGYAANPAHSRPNNRLQYLFLNGRAIRDRGLQHALGEAYRGLLLTGRYPISFLRLEMPPQMVDVNVHPTKLEVRFQDAGRLYSQLLGTLRSRFLSTDLTARLRPGAEGPQLSADADRTVQLRQEVVDWATAELARRTYDTSQGVPLTGGVAAAGGAGQGAPSDSATADAWLNGERADATQRADADEAPLALHRLDPAAAGAMHWDVDRRGARAPESAAAAAPAGPAAMQVLNRYLVAETGEGLVVIDQHALHERILYEQIREKVLSGALERQSLLVPEPVDLAPAEAAAVLESTALLDQLGVSVSPFGGGTVLVESYPAMLANFRPAELLRSLANLLTNGGKPPDRRDLLDDLLHMIACKAAVKAGDRLSRVEIAALLSQRDLAQDAHHCPHGRPTALLFTREELDRQFQRT